MATTDAESGFDPERIIEALDRHGVDYLLVGGLAANAYGATRPTHDVDCMPERSQENLDRLAAAMRELGARFRVDGDPDAEALKVPLDAAMLDRVQVATWRTDAGLFDTLADIPDRDGRRVGYTVLVGDAETIRIHGYEVRTASLEAIVASKQYANRPKDHEALPELEALVAERRDARNV